MRTLVVYCHPDPDSFTAAVKSTVVDALTAGGHEVRVRDLYAEGFDPLFSAEERRTHRDIGAHESVAEYAAELRWCEHIVLVYPTWWSGQPAMLKGWIDRVWVRGIAWELPEGARRIEARLHNVRRLTAVTTHGSSKGVNVLEGEAGKRVVTRSLRTMCNRFTRTSWVAMYGLDTSSAEDRAKFLARVAKKLS